MSRRRAIAIALLLALLVLGGCTVLTEVQDDISGIRTQLEKLEVLLARLLEMLERNVGALVEPSSSARSPR